MSQPDAEVLVLGAGIAGLAAARVLHDAGRQVLVVARERGEASRVPAALLNPVRGKRGSVAPEAEAALGALWDFYPRHAELHAGVLRPVPERDRDEWAAKLAGRNVPHRWTEEGLFLETAGWVETGTLLERLAHGLNVVTAEVVSAEGSALHLADGRTLTGEVLVLAGGASGAHLAGLGGRFTPGSVVVTRERFEHAKSYGVYAAGHCLGGSYLPHRPDYTPHTPQADEVEWLLAQGQKLLGFRPEVRSAWGGVRYRLDKDYLKPIPGGYALTGFGSAAYFYAPLYARRLAEAL